MQERRHSPKHFRRKRRSKWAVEPLQNDHDDFYQHSPSTISLLELVEQLEHATEAFQQMTLHMNDDALIVWNDQSHPVSNHLRHVLEDCMLHLYHHSTTENVDLLIHQILQTHLLLPPMLPEQVTALLSHGGRRSFSLVIQTVVRLQPEHPADETLYQVLQQILEQNSSVVDAFTWHAISTCRHPRLRRLLVSKLM